MALGETVPDGSVSQRCRLVAFRFGSIKGDGFIRVRGTLNEFYIRDTLKFAIFEITFHLYFILFLLCFVLIVFWEYLFYVYIYTYIQGVRLKSGPLTKP